MTLYIDYCKRRSDGKWICFTEDGKRIVVDIFINKGCDDACVAGIGRGEFKSSMKCKLVNKNGKKILICGED